MIGVVLVPVTVIATRKGIRDAIVTGSEIKTGIVIVSATAKGIEIGIAIGIETATGIETGTEIVIGTATETVIVTGTGLRGIKTENVAEVVIGTRRKDEVVHVVVAEVVEGNPKTGMAQSHCWTKWWELQLKPQHDKWLPLLVSTLPRKLPY